VQPIPSTLVALAAVTALQAPALAQAEAPKVRGVIQSWYTANESAPDAFTVRRVFLYVNGAVTPQLSYSVLFNPAKYLSLPTVTGASSPYAVSNTGDNRLLEDAFLTAQLGAGWKVRMGQFRPPVSAEALAPVARIPLARRALFLEGNSFGFYRDLGLEVSGPALPGLTTTLGVFNGQTTNQRETNEPKDVAARLDYAFSNLKLGASYLRGVRGATETFAERIGANAAIDFDPLLLSAEALAGTDGTTAKLGWYGQALWRFNPALNTVLRVEEWDADQSQYCKQQDVTLGLNWFYTGNSKLALNLVNQTTSGQTPSRNALAIVAWQLEL
jgi:hypothetical protein